MGSFESTFGLCFELRRADITKIAMAASSVIETLDVLDNIGPGFLSISITDAVDAFALQ